jgi:hypothetical protein
MLDRGEELGLPEDLWGGAVERLEHEVADAPRTSGPAGEWFGLACNVERGQDVRRRT